MKINVSNRARLIDALEEAQARANARTIDIEDIERAALEAQKRVDSLLYRVDQKGARFVFDVHAQKFPASYRFRPQSTRFTLEKGARDWFLTKIERNTCTQSRVKFVSVIQHSDAIMKKIKKGN